MNGKVVVIRGIGWWGFNTECVASPIALLCTPAHDSVCQPASVMMGGLLEPASVILFHLYSFTALEGLRDGTDSVSQDFATVSIPMCWSIPHLRQTLERNVVSYSVEACVMEENQSFKLSI